MEGLKNYIKQICLTSIKECFEFSLKDINLELTKKNYNGHYTLVLFELTKKLNKSANIIGTTLGDFLIKKYTEVDSFNIQNFFLNINISNKIFNDFLNINFKKNNFGFSNKIKKIIITEYSSPNTNKPLHLGHVRNNLLGVSISRILEAVGNKVIKTQIINDRGIHICKSMIAWIKYGEKKTPETTNIKGDHFVGQFYIMFNKIYKKQVQDLIEQGVEKDIAKKKAPILIEAKKILIKWEKGNNKIYKIWKTMNNWTYKGFEVSYKRLGINFDFIQYESNTYLIGKKVIKEGLNKNIFFKKKDGSIWCDLKKDGFDEKLLLRNDGTSVYITQDLGTIIERITKYKIDKIIYIVGDEQNYHFKILFLILKKLNILTKESFQHLSYSMVDLPDGKMKSREGKVVEADDLMEEMYKTAKLITSKSNKIINFNIKEKNDIYEIIGLGALKYFLLKVHPNKKILFNPEDSINFNGDTGPFIQYTHARIVSLLEKSPNLLFSNNNVFNKYEIDILLKLDEFYEVIQKSALNLNPSLIANYVYNISKLYNTFYQKNFILKEKNEDIKNSRLLISKLVKITIKNSLYLLGIKAPNKM